MLEAIFGYFWANTDCDLLAYITCGIFSAFQLC